MKPPPQWAVDGERVSITTDPEDSRFYLVSMRCVHPSEVFLGAPRMVHCDEKGEGAVRRIARFVLARSAGILEVRGVAPSVLRTVRKVWESFQPKEN